MGRIGNLRPIVNPMSLTFPKEPHKYFISNNVGQDGILPAVGNRRWAIDNQPDLTNLHHIQT